MDCKEGSKRQFGNGEEADSLGRESIIKEINISINDFIWRDDDRFVPGSRRRNNGPARRRRSVEREQEEDR